MNPSYKGIGPAVLVSEAMESLSDNRLRSALSLLGVAIGIAAIIVVSSIASSGRDKVFRELETFGLRTFWVFRARAADDRLERDAVGSGIDTSDYRDLAHGKPPWIARLSPVVDPANDRRIATRGARNLPIRLVGVNHEYDQINGDIVEAGRFLSPEDVRHRRAVAVIGPVVAQRLFPAGGEIVGQRISVDDTWVLVVGVLAEKGRELVNSLGAGGAEEVGARILIPYTVRQSLLVDNEFVSYLQGQASSIDDASTAIRWVTEVLETRHRGAIRYKGESMSTYVSTANKILGTVSTIGIVAAAVSLLVGGLAIMNIMSTSVIERTREIGLRRAIGATQLAIRSQFLIEAVLISASGGLFGVLAGVALVHAATAFSSIQVGLSLPGVVLAMGSTFAVGLASGYYPALKASQLRPVEALRHD